MILRSSDSPPPAGHTSELHFFFLQPHEGRIKKAQIQRAAGEFPPRLHLLICALTQLLTEVFASGLQKDPFIQMYEERPVDVAAYVCRLLDQMPASPSSPTYMD